MWTSKFVHLFSNTVLKINKSFDEVLKKNVRNYCTSWNLAEKALQNPSEVKVLPEEEMKQFRSYFPNLVEDLTENNLVSNLDEFNEIFKEVLHYNVPTGKQIRAAILIAAFKFIIGKNQLHKEKFREIAMVAWCIEMISSYILIMDDIVDNSETRRGKKAWFKHEKVGLRAINDSTVIQMSVFKLLDKYLSNHQYHQDISKVFVEVILKTFVGQVMDSEKWHHEKCTMERFNNIAYNKTGYYTFYFPVMTAMFLAGRPDLQLGTEGHKIFLELGRFYQLQNDFMDVYGEDYSGKLGTDIQEGKYSWLIIKALEKASPVQKEILKNCYGKWDPNYVQQVQLIFKELELKNMYDDEVKDIYQKVLKYIGKMKSEVARELMFGITRICLGYDFLLK